MKPQNNLKISYKKKWPKSSIQTKACFLKCNNNFLVLKIIKLLFKRHKKSKIGKFKNCWNDLAGLKIYRQSTYLRRKTSILITNGFKINLKQLLSTKQNDFNKSLLTPNVREVRYQLTVAKLDCSFKIQNEIILKTKQLSSIKHRNN